MDQINNSDEWFRVAEREIARPLACEILGTCACTQGDGLLGIAAQLGHEETSVAAELALAAWEICAVRLNQTSYSDYYEICAEAESLLQCGWFPEYDDV